MLNKLINSLVNWYLPKLRKEIHKELQKEYDEKIFTAQKITDAIVQTERDKVKKVDNIRLTIDRDLQPLIINKTNLATQKEQMDIAHLVNLPQYQSLRSVHLKTIASFYDQAASKDPITSNVIIQFTELLKGFVLDMDRMKIEHPEEATQDAYDQ